MDQQNISLSNFPEDKKARIVGVDGGVGFIRKLQVWELEKDRRLRLFQNNHSEDHLPL